MIRYRYLSLVAVIAGIVCGCAERQVPAEDSTPLADHPLAPVVKQLTAMKAQADKELLDYTCTITTRERVDGKYEERQFEAKVRSQPQAIYAKLVKPAAGGTEMLYDAGVNEDRLLVAQTDESNKRSVQKRKAWAQSTDCGTHTIPVPALSLHNLLERIIDVVEHDAEYGECRVRTLPPVKRQGVNTTCIEIVHPRFSRNFVFHKSLTFIDPQLNLPVGYETYDWPEKDGDEPALIARFEYTNIKPNVKLTADDFSPQNPNYRFRSE